MENETPLNSFESLGISNSSFYKKKIIASIFLFLIFLFSFFYFLFSAPRNFPNGVIINIKEGENLRDVSLFLKESRIIRSRLAFEAFVILYGGEKHIISTDYFFENGFPVYEIARRISKGERHLAPVKITIPEGYNLSEIVQSISPKLLNFNKDNFLLKAKEGYVFPDTYFFLTTHNEEDILKATSLNYEKKIAPLRGDITSFRKTEKEIITMASIVEKEAKGDADRVYIAGILWKRLSINMALQVDAAPETYRKRGLPGSPISNPGLEAIIATLHPKTSQYLYYLHDKEGNVHFAKSFQEHINNKIKYLK